MRSLAFLIAFAPALCWGQLSVKATPMVKLGGVEGLKMIQDTALLPQTATLTQVPVSLLEIDTIAANVTVEVTDANRLPIPFESFDPLTHMLTRPGRQWVDVIALDFEKNVYSRKTLIVVVGGPDPGPGPEPDPDPDPEPDPDPPDPPDPGPFDDLALRVWEHAKNASEENRQAMKEVMETVAEKMNSFEWRQGTQAREYIQRNWPQCDHCRKISDLLQADAADRELSWEEFQKYYREVAKGVDR